MLEGTVKIDDSSELENLYQIARRAKDTDNDENALKYYDMILLKDSDSWEAQFYVVYFKARLCKIKEIENAAKSIKNCLPSVFALARRNDLQRVEMNKVIFELLGRTNSIAEMLYKATRNHYDKYAPDMRAEDAQDYVDRTSAISELMYGFGDSLELEFSGLYGVVSAKAWEKGIEYHRLYIRYLVDRETNRDIILNYANRIKNYDHEYVIPTIDITPFKPYEATLEYLEKKYGSKNSDSKQDSSSLSKSSGCYIATAVYGSYNCPQVWTLRRFRDNTLDATWYGRVFIKTYYAISPTLVRWFGNTSWFKDFWRKPLDKLVATLRNKGVKDTPYIDKY